MRRDVAAKAFFEILCQCDENTIRTRSSDYLETGNSLLIRRKTDLDTQGKSVPVQSHGTLDSGQGQRIEEGGVGEVNGGQERLVVEEGSARPAGEEEDPVRAEQLTQLADQSIPLGTEVLLDLLAHEIGAIDNPGYNSGQSVFRLAQEELWQLEETVDTALFALEVDYH